MARTRSRERHRPQAGRLVQIEVAKRLLRLLDRGVASRRRKVEEGQDVLGLVSAEHRDRARGSVRRIVEAVTLAVASGDLGWLRDVERLAEDLVEEHRGVVPVAGPERRENVFKLRDYLYQEIADRLDPKVCPEPPSDEDLAHECSEMISIAEGLNTDGLPDEEREAVILAGIRRALGLKRPRTPEVVVRAALRACGIDAANLFKAEQMADVRRRRRQRGKQ